MPTSDYHQISDVLHVVEHARPRSVLDVGVGFGKWGILCREVLEVYQERVQPDSWQCRVDGVEIFESYRNPLWALAYNHVEIGDAFDTLARSGRYDLILCCDVIEHFDKDKGHRLLAKMLDHGKIVVVTSPRGFVEQGAAYGNEHERHKSGWGEQDFSPYHHVYKDVGFTFLAVLARNQPDLAAVRPPNAFQVLGVKRAAREFARLCWDRARSRLGAR